MTSWRTKPLPPNWGRTRRRILRRDRGVCYVCHGAVAGAKEVDHIVPVSQQGGEEDSNLAAICSPCHARKTAAEANAVNPMARPRKRAEEKHPGDISGA